MARYMRQQFSFLGIPSPMQAALAREALAELRPASADDLRDLALGLWALPEREYQYAACGVLGRHARLLGPGFLDTAARLITTRPWWDTVDSLAKNVVGAIVLRHHETGGVVDEWIDARDMWLRRTALLHQLGYKERTNVERLFRYCTLRAGESEFFIRKAIGWALREYSKVAPQAVIAFVAQNERLLSPLSRKEALKWLTVRESGRRAAAAAGIDLGELGR
jgi:3-methyladenine DNA glycosylase AlkD